MIRKTSFPDPVHRWQCSECDAGEAYRGLDNFKRAKVGAIEHTDAEGHPTVVLQYRMLVERPDYEGAVDRAEESGSRTVIGQTDKKSTAYTWAKKARDRGSRDVQVEKVEDFYVVSRAL